MWAPFPINYPLIFQPRTQTSVAAKYWREGTNNVRRHLLMAGVKQAIYREWDPPGRNTPQNVAELRSLARRRLTAAVVSSVHSQVRRMSN